MCEKNTTTLTAYKPTQVKKIKKLGRDFPGGPVAKVCSSNAVGPGSVPGQGTRFHILQLRPGAAK